MIYATVKFPWVARWSHHWHAQSCDGDLGTCAFKLDLSRLFYLCSPCKMLLSSILYELLSLIYRGKTSEMSQAWSYVFCNLRHNSFQTKGRLVQMVDQNEGKFLKTFSKTSKKDCILTKSIFFRRSSLGDIYIESDRKIPVKILLWAL